MSSAVGDNMFEFVGCFLCLEGLSAETDGNPELLRRRGGGLDWGVIWNLC